MSGRVEHRVERHPGSDQCQGGDAAAMLVLPNLRWPGRGTRGDQDIDVVEDRLHSCCQLRFGREHFFDLAIGDQAADSGNGPGAGLQPLRVGQTLHRVVHAAPHPWQDVAVHRPGRVVRVTPDHLVTEVAQHAFHAVECPLLSPSHPGDHRRSQLGAQRNSQPARLAGRSLHEAAPRSLLRVGHVEEQGGVLDRACHRPVDAQPAPGVRTDRNPVALRLQTVQTAPSRRDPDRTGPVGTQCHRRQPGRHCGTASTAAAAGGVGQIPGVVRGPESHRLGERPQHHLRHGGLPEDHRAGGTQSTHHLGIGGRLQVVGTASETGEFAGDVGVVLDRDRNTEQWQALPGVEPLLCGNRLPSGVVRHHDSVRPQLPVDPRDAVEIQLHQRRRGDGSGREHPGLHGGPGEGDIGDVHSPQRSRNPAV